MDSCADCGKTFSQSDHRHMIEKFALCDPCYHSFLGSDDKNDQPVDGQRSTTERKKLSALAVIGRIGIILIGIVLIFSGLYRISSTFDASGTPSAMSIAELKEKAHEIPYEDLMRHNEQYRNALVYFLGKIVQVGERSGDSYVLRVATKEDDFLGFSDDIIWVNWEGERLLEKDIIEIWGRVTGLKSYTAVLGNQVTVPEIDAAYIQRVEQEE